MWNLIVKIFEFIRNWSDILIMIGGFSAIVVYFGEKRYKIRSAATVVVGQIRDIEDIIKDLKKNFQLNNVIVYNSKDIIKENMWEKHKHIFVKKLSNDEFNMVQNFFDEAEKLERERMAIVKALNVAWEAKSHEEWKVISEFIVEEMNRGENRGKNIDLNMIENKKQFFFREI